MLLTRRLLTAGVASLVVAGASAGVAQAAVNQAVPSPACTPATTTPFAAFGDQNAYFGIPGGNFESGAPGWTFADGAGPAAGNNTAGTDPAADSTSLSLPAGSSATSPSVCVTVNAPSMRFFVRNTGKPTSLLGVTVLFTLPNGAPASLLVGAMKGSGTWQPGAVVFYLANLLARVSPTGTTNVAFRFAPLDSTGQWRVDDVYIDPIKRR